MKTHLVAMEHATDAELVARVGHLEQPAFVELYRRYGRRVYPLILRIVSRESLAEEILQDVFLRLWTRPDRYRPEAGHLLAWLLTVARNLALDALRREHRWRDHLEIDEQLHGSLSTRQPSVDAAVGIAVRHAVLALPDEQRRTLELAYYSGMTNEELAGHLGEPLGTVKSRLRLALGKLRKALGAEADRTVATG
ncbi:MAG: sigma-70 family RNA polymerase sigma factor [Vicinamibacteria bacterium]